MGQHAPGNQLNKENKMNSDITKLAGLISKAQRIAVLTGAGMSTESGIPDYRSTDGLYRTLTSEEVFDIDRFRSSPKSFYEVIGPLYCSIVEAQPNPGHLALAEIETRLHKRVDIATQNIDGLHHKALSKRIYEVHGTMKTLTCQRCHKQIDSDNYLPSFKNGEVLSCKCGGVFKPDITFYGESLPQEAFTSAIDAFEHCDLAIVLGTSLKVYPAAMLPSYRRTDVPLVIINKTETDADASASIVIHGKIGEVLPQAIALL